MSKTVVMTALGGPEVLDVRDIPVGDPGPGQVRLRQSAIGVNFVDVYVRKGIYAPPSLPAVPGVEGAGIIEAVGAGVEDLKPGDRVAYAGPLTGGYAAERLIAADGVILLPDALEDRIAAAAMLRGITAHMLLAKVHPIGSGQVVLVHAAAGGLGLILTQWAKRLGASVIGTVGSSEKAALAQRYGADHTILYRDMDFVAAVKDLTGGKGVDAAYDGIGGATLAKSIQAVRAGGTLASIGQASGPKAEVDAGAVRLVHPSVLAHVQNRTDYRDSADALFTEIAAGLKIEIGLELPLSEAAEAHRRMEAAQTVGSVVLRP